MRREEQHPGHVRACITHSTYLSQKEIKSYIVAVVGVYSESTRRRPNYQPNSHITSGLRLILSHGADFISLLPNTDKAGNIYRLAIGSLTLPLTVPTSLLMVTTLASTTTSRLLDKMQIINHMFVLSFLIRHQHRSITNKHWNGFKLDYLYFTCKVKIPLMSDIRCKILRNQVHCVTDADLTWTFSKVK